VFINNYQRVEQLPAHEEVRLRVELPGETLEMPSEPVTIGAGATAIWPFNLKMEGVLLKYATAQPLCRLEDEEQPSYVFWATVEESEFVFDSETVEAIAGDAAHVTASNGRMRVDRLTAGTGCQFWITGRAGKPIHVLLLSREEALRSYKVAAGTKERLLISPGTVLADGQHLRVQSSDPKELWWDISPESPEDRPAFTHHWMTVNARAIETRVTMVKAAAPARPAKIVQGKAQAPGDADFKRAGVWRVQVPPDALEGFADLILAIDYEGDVGRAYLGDRLIADDFFDGRVWEIGIRRFAPAILGGELTLKVLPLRKDAPVYLAPDKKPEFGESGEVARVRGVRAVPVYEAVVDME
jgi:beta-galactosidase